MDAHEVDGSHQMQDMLLAIWQQDFDQLIQMQAVGLLVTCLVVILFSNRVSCFCPCPATAWCCWPAGWWGWGCSAPR